MPSSSSSYAQLRYRPEATYAVAPTGAPVNLRMTGESLDYAIQTITSNEIRSDRQTTDLIQTGFSVNGGFNFEFSHTEYDPFIEAALQGTWAYYGTGTGASLGQNAATFSATINSTTNTITVGAALSGNDAFNAANVGIQVGGWFRVIAPTDAAHNAVCRASSVTSTVITVDMVIKTDGTTATSIPGTGSRATVNTKLSSARLSNGTTRRSFAIEKDLTDIKQRFAYNGLIAGKWSMNFAAGEIVTGAFEFLGSTSVRNTGAASYFTGATFDGNQQINNAVASQTFDVMNAVSGVGGLLENGAALSGTFIKSLKFDVDNALRGQTAIGYRGFADVVAGTLAISGEAEVYLADGTMYDKYVNSTASSLMWLARDVAGNGYVIQFPKIKYGGAKVMAGGKDQDMMLSMPFTALLDPTSQRSIIVTRV